MKKQHCYILTILAMLLDLIGSSVLVSCADDYEQQEHEVQICVRGAWQNGRATHATRALTATDILASGTGDIAIAFDDYPATINIHCSDGTDFTLTKGVALCGEHHNHTYWQYTPSVIYKDRDIQRNDLTFSATATIDDGGDVLEGTADKDNIDGRHLHLTLHHTRALLRFAFKVSEKYDRVRYIRITGITFNGTPIYLADNTLTTENQPIAYTYIDPKQITTSTENTLCCTYDIYDKDATTGAEHITRQGVEAKNTFTLNKLVFNSSAVEKIKAGYYYDLRVTLNPDYLYVLSDHDNKHITIE